MALSEGKGYLPAEGVGYLSWKSETETPHMLSVFGSYPHTTTDTTAHTDTNPTIEVITTNGELLITTANTVCSARRRGPRSGNLPRRTAEIRCAAITERRQKG